jgi:hypothetical protein
LFGPAQSIARGEVRLPADQCSRVDQHEVDGVDQDLGGRS